ncbi:hypothetical protein Tco_0557274 [Tanacetum coccineum]
MCQDTILGGAEAQIRFEAASKQFNDPPLLRANTLGSGEDNIKLKKSMESCTKLSKRTLDLEYKNRQSELMGKQGIITETSVTQALHLKDAKGTDCLPTATIFVELERMGVDRMERAATTASSLEAKQDSGNINRTQSVATLNESFPQGTDSEFSGPIDPTSRKVILTWSGVEDSLFDLEAYTNSDYAGASLDRKSTTRANETVINEWEDRMERAATTASSLETEQDSGNINRTQSMTTLNESFPRGTDSGSEIATLKDRVKKLEKKRRSRNYKPRRLYKGRKIADLDADIEMTLIDETQGRNDKDLMFDAGVHNSDEVFQEPIVNTDTTTKSSIPVSAANPVTTTGEVVTTTSVEIPEELTLAQTLIEIKSAKPKAVTTTTVKPASSRPKAKGIVFDEEVARNLEAQLQAKLE